MSEVQFSDNQLEAIDRCLNHRGPNVLFITGNAGTGKSTVLRELRKRMRLLVCAPTGLAAINVRGETIHRMFGLKIGPLMESSTRSVARERAHVLRGADAIVIDEISMVRADLLDGINWTLQKTFDSKEPFAGYPLIVIGDLMQLEPVTGDDWDKIKQFYKSPFWYDAHVFTGGTQQQLIGAKSEIEMVELTQVFRQVGNPEFVDALNAIRVGNADGLTYINARAGIAPPPDNSIVSLTFTNKAATATNARRMGELPGDMRVFEAVVSGEFPEKDLPSPRELELKVGSQVMVTRNIVPQDGSGGYVANGSVGQIVGFLRNAPVVRLKDQTLVLERATWEKIGYELSDDHKRLVEVVEGTYSQFPIKLAWAVTVHKAQGQTLESAIIELESRSFAHGQLYVALSRVKSFDSLYLRRVIGRDDIRVDAGVSEFLRARRKNRQEALL